MGRVGEKGGNAHIASHTKGGPLATQQLQSMAAVYAWLRLIGYTGLLRQSLHRKAQDHK